MGVFLLLARGPRPQLVFPGRLFAARAVRYTFAAARVHEGDWRDSTADLELCVSLWSSEAIPHFLFKLRE